MKAAPHLTTCPGTGGAAGATVTDTATVSGGSAPTGTISFGLYGPNSTADCSRHPVDTEQVTVSSDGSYTTPTGATPPGRTYWWTASYGGDAANKPAATSCGAEQVTIIPATPGIATSQQPATATVGSSVADQVTVTGYHPTGIVFFNVYDNPNCTGAPLFTDAQGLAGGTATSTGYTTTSTGTDYWMAIYNGDANNAAVSSGCADEPVTVTPATPGFSSFTALSMGLPPSAPPNAYVSVGEGESIALQVTVGGFHPAGTITFTLHSHSNCTGPLFADTETLSGGSATSASCTPTVDGLDHWVATYNGDANNNPVSTPCGHNAVVILPGLSTSAGPGGPLGSTVTDTATVSGGSAPHRDDHLHPVFADRLLRHAGGHRNRDRHRQRQLHHPHRGHPNAGGNLLLERQLQRRHQQPTNGQHHLHQLHRRPGDHQRRPRSRPRQLRGIRRAQRERLLRRLRAGYRWDQQNADVRGHQPWLQHVRRYRAAGQQPAIHDQQLRLRQRQPAAVGRELQLRPDVHGPGRMHQRHNFRRQHDRRRPGNQQHIHLPGGDRRLRLGRPRRYRSSWL